MPCGSTHPEQPGLTCIAPRPTGHDQHFALQAGVPVEWKNEEYVEKVSRKRRTSSAEAADRLKKMADKVREAGTGARPPIVGTDDSWSSHLAADRIEPRRGTRKAAVLAVLRSARGSWVDGSALAHPEVGGSEGLRRLRELREADGWPIERRPNPTSATSWQYRLSESVPSGLASRD